MNIILLDDHRIFGESFSNLITEDENINSCDFVMTDRELYEYMEGKIYDICIIDIDLGSDKNGFQILEEILEKYDDQKVMILSSYDYPVYRQKAFDIGAKDYISKSLGIEEILNRINSISDNIKKKIYTQDPLTKREIQVLHELISGKCNSEIAKSLYISESTLYNHINNIYDKLDAKNKVDAYNKAIKIGYVDPIM